MSKILIIGASGSVGRKIYDLMRPEGAIGTYQSRGSLELLYLDITNKREVRDFFARHKPEVVVHTAAMPDPDDCERRSQLVRIVNYSKLQK